MCDCGPELSRRQWLFSTLVASAAAILTPITGRAEDSPAVQGETMLKKGFPPDEAGKILGGNYVRVFAKATGGA